MIPVFKRNFFSVSKSQSVYRKYAKKNFSDGKRSKKRRTIVRKKNNFLASFLHVLSTATRDISKINFQVTERDQCSRFSWNELFHLTANANAAWVLALRFNVFVFLLCCHWLLLHAGGNIIWNEESKKKKRKKTANIFKCFIATVLCSGTVCPECESNWLNRHRVAL